MFQICGHCSRAELPGFTPGVDVQLQARVPVAPDPLLRPLGVHPAALLVMVRVPQVWRGRE